MLRYEMMRCILLRTNGWVLNMDWILKRWTVLGDEGRNERHCFVAARMRRTEGRVERRNHCREELCWAEGHLPREGVDTR